MDEYRATFVLYIKMPVSPDRPSKQEKGERSRKRSISSDGI